MMDYHDFRTILDTAGVDVWTFIDTAIGVACSDYGDELKHRRDGIVERLYTAASLNNTPPPCRNCDAVDVVGLGVGNSNRNRLSSNNGHVAEAAAVVVEKDSFHDGKFGASGSGGGGSPSTPQSVDIEDDNDDGDDNRDLRYGDLFDDEQVKILTIKEQLEDPKQTEESLVELLQTLADMDLTFDALKESDIGRHVNHLRKHPSSYVRRSVKQLVRKWKYLVDEWVRLNPPDGGQASSAAFMVDEDSPQQKVAQNGHHQVPDFAYSPNPHNGSSGSDKNNAEPELKIKTNVRRETPTKSVQPSRFPASAPPNRQQKAKITDAERLASARKRLQDNYKEAENAKRQRTIQVMGIHEIPKPKNTFFAKNKGSSHGRHW